MNMSIGENIKTMRRKCGFTQEELAERLSVTAQAVSKWENGNGLPDITQIIPLAKIFGITTDSLLGVVSATYGEAHTEASLDHVRLLMNTSKSAAEKHLAAYTYLRAESEKEPTNYVLMRKCINHAAEISRYADFDSFMSDSPEILDEIFADCERKNACISRYCEDKINVEKSDYAMIWIYLHIRQFDKAMRLIDRLPSLDSICMREHIMTQFVHFQFGFESEKEVISDNIRKLMCVTAKDFFYSLEDYAWFADPAESIELSRKMLGVLEAYKTFDFLMPDLLFWELPIRKLLPRCYCAQGDLDAAGSELVTIAECSVKLSQSGEYTEADEARSEALKCINEAVATVDEKYRDLLRSTEGYKKAMDTIEKME